MTPDIFKAYDIRGKVGDELNPEVMQRVGRAFADWLPNEGAVAVGYDMRPDSKSLAEAVVAGLTEQGRDVVMLGNIATDMIYFAVGSLGLAGGAVVTASHNPGEYNGMKLCREEAKPVGIETGLGEIRDHAIAGEFRESTGTGKIEEKDITDDWVDHVLGFVSAQSWPSYHIAIDAGNGMLGKVAPEFAAKIPQLKVEEMYYELDGTFPNHIANPLVPENLVDLQAKIREMSLDFGIAFDGDGDRAVVVDEKGEAVSGTIMTAILARYFLEKNPGSTILYNAIVGRVVPDLVAKLGGESHRTRVGHSFIKDDMRKYDAIFAGEHSSHYYFRDNWSADSGLLAATILIQVLANSGKKLSELADEYRTSASIPETNFEVEDKQVALSLLREKFDDGEQDELDGLTVSYDDAWFNVRCSNTEPLLRLNAEASNLERLDEIVSKVTEVIRGSA